MAPQRDWSFPLHAHVASAELSLITKGKGFFYAQNVERPVEKGMLVAKNPGLSHSERSDPQDPLEQICIEIENVHMEGLSENFVLPWQNSPILFTDSDFPLLEQCFRFIMDNYRDASCRELCGLVLDTALAVIAREAEKQKHVEKRPRSKREFASEALNYLDEHYREKLRIADLANIFSVSEGNLSRQFKKVTGYTVNEYITSKRMGEAQRQLIYEDRDIKDIAAFCGYEDIQYFYHVFKSYAHCTPLEFREKYR